MWSIYARSRVVGRLPPSPHIRLRHASTLPLREVLSKAMLRADGEAAKALLATNVWKPHRSKARAKIPGEKTRVNITSDKLCDDIEKYIGPSLQRHVGCDLIDLFPGAGVWSQKLHDIVKPRAHILMEPDEPLYAPFLESLASNPGVTVVPKSGLVWTDLHAVLDSLPHQVALDPNSESPPPRNDTLLVTANLSFYPKTRATALYLYQLISAIRTGSLFQKYGLVRMLIWVRDEDIRPTILPAAVQMRGRSALEAELSCEWINEVAGLDSQDEGLRAAIYRAKKSGSPRDRLIELASAHQTLRRMREQGVTVPAGRETAFLKEAMDITSPSQQLSTGVQTPSVALPYAAELEGLEARHRAGELERGSVDYKRLLRLRYRQTSDAKQAASYADLLQEHAELARLRREGAADEATLLEKTRQWNERVDSLHPHSLSSFRLVRDNLHLFHQDPPVMLWDRRTLEPMVVEPAEFFPNVGCSLLDVQPKAPNLFLGRHREGSKVFDLLAKAMMRNSTVPVSERLDDVWPDAAEGVIPHCHSLRDAARGGTAGDGHAELCTRVLNEGQWAEIVEAWLGWHFRPRWERLMRQHEEVDEDDDEGGEDDFIL